MNDSLDYLEIYDKDIFDCILYWLEFKDECYRFSIFLSLTGILISKTVFPAALSKI